MCGLIGIGGPRGAELVGALLPTLHHRGPDAEGVWTSPELTLGHRRLAIIGLDEGGRQPKASASGRSWIVFNGEVYNYLELADELEAAGHVVDRRYDTAVLLTGLEAEGTAFLPKLDGMFSFAWYRPEEKRLLLVRDRWGKKPLFWGRVRLDDGSRVLAFASELRVFARLPGGPPPPDPLGVARYLVYDGMPATRTVYRGVEKVAAASWVELDPDGDRLAEGTYWSYPIEPADVGEDLEERIGAALQRALELRLRSDVPVGLFLSGGIDSSLLAAAWRRARPDETIRTFTVGFDESSYDERASARRMAEAIRSEHQEIVLRGSDLERELDEVWDHLSEPFADPSIVPMSALCRFARERVTVALGGDGADELQAGYDPFRAWAPARVAESCLSRPVAGALVRGLEAILPASPANLSWRFKARHFAQGFLHPPEERIQGWMASFPLEQALGVLHPDLAAEVDREEVLLPTRSAFRRLRDRSPLQAQIHTWIRTYLECSILTKVDRAGMMHSLEVRAPFLDPDFAELLTALPDELVFARGRGKVSLRRLAARTLPPELLHKPKKGLGVPQATWLRTVLRPRMEDCLARNRQGGWFRPDAIERRWESHRSGRGDERRSLWCFLFSFPFQRRC